MVLVARRFEVSPGSGASERSEISGGSNSTSVGARGSSTRKVAPPPGVGATPTRPPCAVTTAATIDSPSPDPPPWLAGSGGVDPVEPLEDPIGVLGRQARARGHAPRAPRGSCSPSRRPPRPACPAGVCRTALPTRLATTCRSRSVVADHHGRLRARRPAGARPVGPCGRGPVPRASCTASPASTARSTGSARAGRCSSSRASSSRSSTRPPIRGASSSIRRHRAGHVVRLADRALPVQLGEPADRGQRGAQLVRGVGGEPAGALLRGLAGTGRRSRSGPASRSATTSAGRPRWTAGWSGTRWERSPAAIAAAVSSTSASGRKARRIANQPSRAQIAVTMSPQPDHDQA